MIHFLVVAVLLLVFGLLSLYFDVRLLKRQFEQHRKGVRHRPRKKVIQEPTQT